jgi:transposase-like protein
VIAVARQGGQSIAQVARGFGVSKSCLSRWLRIADRDEGRPAPPSGAGATLDEAEVRELRRRNKQLEQENEILRRATAYFTRDTLQLMYPLVRDLAADGIPVAVTCRVLGFSKQAYDAWRAPGHRRGLGRRAPDQRRDRDSP